MPGLRNTEKTIINQLFDQEMFTSTPADHETAAAKNAREAYKRPETQRRINYFLRDLIGTTPLNFQDDLLLLTGPGRLSQFEVQVLLATLKAVINSPEMQDVTGDGVVDCLAIVTTVQSQLPEHTAREVRKCIDDLFVTRFPLFVPDRPEMDAGEAETEIEEYWDVSPDFLAEAQNLVLFLQAQEDPAPVTASQRVNLFLLKHAYLAAAAQPELWQTLLANKIQIEAQWRQLDRFYLEIGDDYALLLDANRTPLRSRPYFIAAKVAQTLGQGLPDAALNGRIRSIGKQLYPRAEVAAILVRQALGENAFAYQRDDFWLATPLAGRLKLVLDEQENFDD
ncbi:hypothetical protein [Lacticaseibacillus mingshuiensis]|uniref:Uncharacterized protein n=1 Tax=Lacticaseibacillus mingshuiensis TaxID=2799574 RepID=A0ABW4CFT6_9LACO|nr:hypothetical protein [Lacticaseibacillus mingshuiensis]